MRVIRLRPSGRATDSGAIFLGAVKTQRVVGEETSGIHRIVEVTFTHGARTKLHEHTADQVLLITDGRGVVGTRGERHEVAAGDVVFIPAREPHFHGAAPGKDMTHYSVLGPGETKILE